MSQEELIEKLRSEMEEKYGSNAPFRKKIEKQPENLKEITVRETVKSTGGQGIFENVEDAINAAKESQKQLMKLSMKERGVIIQAMRKTSLENAERLAIMAREETGMGRAVDKTAKNRLAAEKTPGPEILHPYAYTGDDGLTLMELAPYGVIGSITPSTNPTSTIINNSISMISAGNGVVFNPHPNAKKCCNETISLLNKAIESVGGPKELITAPLIPTMDSSKVIMHHPDVRMLTVTGGEAVVNIAMISGKKVIAAGPGNPPVIVDETANIPKAAKDIFLGASFDNNIVCIAEKEVFAINSIFNQLRSEMLRYDVYELKRHEIDLVTKEVFQTNKEGKIVVNRKYVGKDASVILKASGIPAQRDYKLIIAEVDENHPFVTVEMLMPVLGLVRVYSIDEAIEKAVKAENGNHHSAHMHSESVTNLTKAARAVDTTIFVKNAPSLAGIGFGGEGYTSLTLATPTGEGVTSAISFTRRRRCTLSGAFRII